MGSNQLSYEKSLLAVLEKQVGIIERRLAKSGVSYFAISRFDSVKEILEEDFSPLIGASQHHEELIPYVQLMLEISDALNTLAKNNPGLASSHNRSDRILKRSELLLDEIRNAAHNSDPNKASFPLGDTESAIDRAEFENLWDEIRNT